MPLAVMTLLAGAVVVDPKVLVGRFYCLIGDSGLPKDEGCLGRFFFCLVGDDAVSCVLSVKYILDGAVKLFKFLFI